jgi:outer membrane protein OmpA-like peptidoglycan-associated protein
MRPLASFRLIAALAASLALLACQTPSGLSPEQIALLKDSGFDQTSEGWELNLESRLLFDISSASLDSRERASLDRIARTLASIDIYDIVIEGHTDSTGSEAYNRSLSLKRAAIVRDRLAEAGLPAGRMQIRGMGSENPIASNTTRSGRKENRRTVIIIPSR